MTVEEKIQHLQQEKAALADGLFSEGNGDGWKLDEADIDALFALAQGALRAARIQRATPR